MLAEDDAAGNQAGDLLEYHAGTVAFDGDDVLLVPAGGILFTGHQEMSGLIEHVGNPAGEAGAVDRDVKDVEKDTDAIAAGSIGFDRDHFAIRRRDGDRPGGNDPVGIAE